MVLILPASRVGVLPGISHGWRVPGPSSSQDIRLRSHLEV